MKAQTRIVEAVTMDQDWIIIIFKSLTIVLHAVTRLHARVLARFFSARGVVLLQHSSFLDKGKYDL